MTKTQQDHLNSYGIILLDLVRRFNSATDVSLQVISRDAIRSMIRKATEQVGCCAGRGKVTALYISEAALAQINSGDGSNIIYEHIVPISVLTKRFFDKVNEWDTPNKITQFLIDNTKTALITKAEDKRLKDAGLNKSMPNLDIFSRYTHQDVNIVLVERTEKMATAQKSVLG